MNQEYAERTRAQYTDYISTDKWNNRRKKRLEIDGFTCQMCGCKGTPSNPLQIHHLTYNHIYGEDIEKDLVCLCRSCHMAVHHMMNRITDVKEQKHGWKDTLTISTVVYEQNLKQLAEQNGVLIWK